VMYERITGHDARALPKVAVFGSYTVPTATVQLLQDAAHKANIDYPSPSTTR
jgi:hypothetical protein